MKRAILCASLSLAVGTASAWTTSGLPSARALRHDRRLAAAPEGADEDGPSLERRDFLHAAAQAAVASVIPVVTAAYPNAAVAAADVPYSKVYRPAPHSMDGRVVVVTGGNTGLGLESSKRLAAAGATVVFTSRDAAKGEKALAEIDAYLKETRAADETFAGRAAYATLDLCDLADVKSFDGRLSKVLGKDATIDVLMNNAGVMAVPDRRLTRDGYEKTFQTNHLGHFALTSALLPRLAPDARVINVASEGYQFAPPSGLDFDNLNGEKEYGPWSSYGQSKLENILFTNELQRRASLSEKWQRLAAYSLHPGAVQTDLARYLIGEEKFASMKEKGFESWTDKAMMEGLAKFVKTVQEGASTQVFLAASDVGPSGAGGYFADGKMKRPRDFATDREGAERLWTKSEELAGVKFDL